MYVELDHRESELIVSFDYHHARAASRESASDIAIAFDPLTDASKNFVSPQ
jgi:hypothetical protein